MCCRGTAKLEDAADLYVRAGNSFKVAKKFAGTRTVLNVSRYCWLMYRNCIVSGYEESSKLPILSLSSTAAGDAYCSAAKLHRDKLDTRHEAANNFADAASVFRKVKPEGKDRKF